MRTEMFKSWKHSHSQLSQFKLLIFIWEQKFKFKQHGCAEKIWNSSNYFKNRNMSQNKVIWKYFQINSLSNYYKGDNNRQISIAFAIFQALAIWHSQHRTRAFAYTRELLLTTCKLALAQMQPLAVATTCTLAFSQLQPLGTKNGKRVKTVCLII